METTLTLIAHLTALFRLLSIMMEARNLWTLAVMTALLMKGIPAHLYALARALPCQGELESRAQKLRRWMDNPTITPCLFLPAFLKLLTPLLLQLGDITLIIDRTSWKRLGIHLNLFLCSIAFHGRAFPVFWFFLPTRGCSSLTNQKALLRPVLTALSVHPLLSPLPVTVVADRECCSPQFAQWLTEQGVHFCIRVKQNDRVSRTDFPSIPISQFLEHAQPGEYYFYSDVRLTDEHQFPVNLLIFWRPDCDEPIALIADLNEASALLTSYQQRPWIETFNRDLKSSGFDIERGKLNRPERLTNFLIPMALAYILLVILGYAEDDTSPPPPPPLRKGQHDDIVPSPPPKATRTYSLFTRARNRMTDLHARTPLETIRHVFGQFFACVEHLLSQTNGQHVHTLLHTYAQQQAILLQGVP